jgi:hypothetical protein
VLNKADTAAADNAPLFDLIKQPIKHVTPATKGRGKAALAQGSNPLMILPPQPTPTPRLAPTTTERKLPAWIRAFRRPPLQVVLTFADCRGNQHRQPIIQFRSIEQQDIECTREINTIFGGGGSNIVMEFIATATGQLITRHAVDRGDDGSLVYRLIAVGSRYELADAAQEAK